MLVPIKWLKDYIDYDVDLKTFCEKMIMSGSNIETAENFGEVIDKVVIGKTISVDRHPDADKLVICKLDIGEEEPTQIVTGAENIFPDDFVPVALHGSRIPGPVHGQPKQEGGVKIKKGKLRGITSSGMICSHEELGFEDKAVPLKDRDGIWVLDEEAKPGITIQEYLGLSTGVIDFEITPNRADCLSMLG
ncbi:MAG: phenylalanine--tRNA ligase subunit beta, partial [Anaerovoracaceae bacterium]